MSRETASESIDELWPLGDVVSELRSWQEDLQVEAIRQAQRQREAIGPLLIHAIRDIQANAPSEPHVEGFDAFLPICLLTEFRTPGALEAILDLLRGSVGVLDIALGPSLHEDLPTILAGWIDDPDVIDRWIADTSLTYDTRWAFASALAYLVRDGRLSGKEAVERLHARLKDALEQRDQDLADALCYEAGSYGLPEPLETIRGAVQDGLVSGWLTDLRSIEMNFRLGQMQFEAKIDSLRPSGVAETVEFANYTADIREELFSMPLFENLDGDSNVESPGPWLTPPLRRESFKIGRNEPCPCGSGKKYKKCCGHADRLI